MTAIAVVGSWHLAHVTAACLAEIGHDVSLYFDAPLSATVYDNEPGLFELEARMVETGRLRHASLACANWARTVWLAEDMPLDKSGAPDAASMFKLAGNLRGAFSDLNLMIVSSQVPIGTCRILEHQLAVPVAYVPENLRLGLAVDDFYHPDRLVIGAKLAETRLAVREMLSKITYGQEHAVVPIECSLETAEMVKHATNVFLATSISFANEIARLGERFDVDSKAVAHALRQDSRIGPKAYVRAGEGFAPGTLARDLRALQWIGKAGGVPTPLVDAVLAVNDAAPKPPVREHDTHLMRRH